MEKLNQLELTLKKLSILSLEYVKTEVKNINNGTSDPNSASVDTCMSIINELI